MAMDVNTAKRYPAISRKKIELARIQRQHAYNYFETAQSGKQTNQKKSDLSMAKNALNKSLELNPADADSFNLLARIELEAGHLKSAEQAIGIALNIQPSNGGYHYSAGHIALAMRKLLKAEEAFTKAIQYAPKETRADVSLAYTLAESGKTVQAFKHYRELAKTQGEDVHIRSRLLECASQLNVDHYDSELEQDLLNYLSWNNMNRNQLASLTCSLLEHKFQLNQAGSASNFDDMANCPLLICALKFTLIKSELLEKLIMALRCELLSFSTQKGQLPNQYIPLCEAIAHYGLRCEYIIPTTAAEDNMGTALKKIIDQSLLQIGCSPMDVSGALLLLAMYDTWQCLDNYKKLMKFDDASWPDISFAIKQCHDELIILGEYQFDAITTIPEALEHAVKGQYEKHPYPRWQTLDYKTPTNYGQALINEFPGVKLPKHIFSDKIDILVAGCGTGRHALNVAKYFNHVQVTALDISRSSLAYAQYKAKEFNINNISFKLADLTQLQKSSKKYNIIECSGVLHHIKEYKVALHALLQNLKPNGLIKISLYSERARKCVIQIRDTLKSEQSRLSDQQIKVLRHAVFQSDQFENINSVIKSDDFYSLSGTIDLLFHEYEERFTPLTIKDLCDEFDLNWLGFSSVPQDVKLKFHEFNADAADLNNLKQWDDFEEAYPATFATMFQFYCQYSPKLTLK
jgi:ubiquinone/menaquinone biosynthesis C-methylase UbiE